MYMFTDLLREMRDNNHEPSDVLYVCHERGHCTWHEFEMVMKDYDRDYQDCSKLRESFMIVGKDWLIRFHHVYGDEHYSEWKHVNLVKGLHNEPSVDDFIVHHGHIGWPGEEF